MSPGWTIAVVASIAGLIGFRMGLRRMAALAVGTAVAAALAPRAGPALSRWSTTHFAAEPWVRDFVCWTFAYVATAWLASFLANRLFGRGKPAGVPSVRGRLSGGAVAATLGGLGAWLVAGNLANIVVAELPADENSPLAAAVRRPFEMVRACRVLATVTGSEAELLVDRGDIRAVMESDSLDRLLRTPGVIRKVSRAADGDWSALAALAADPAVKKIMNGGDFLDRIREVDVVAMAEDLERSRAAEANRSPAHSSLPRTNSSRTGGRAGGFDGPPARDGTPSWARRLADDAKLRQRVIEEWTDVRGEPQPTERALVGSAPRKATPEEVEAYWKQFGAVLELADGPHIPVSWLPGLQAPAENKPADPK